MWLGDKISIFSENYDYFCSRAKKKLEQKLEKVNVMRFLMVNLLSASNIDYMQHPEWTKVLGEMQGFVSVESFMPSDTETQ